jgi:hypothetical protein
MSARHGTIALLLAVLCLAACTDHDQDRAIERVLHDARRAVLAGDGSRACGLLTRHGRQRAIAFGAERLGERPPVSCEEIVRDRLALAERDPESSWPDDLREATLEVLSVNDGDAQAELRVQDPFGTAIRWRVRLRKTSAGWRINDSNAVPAGR